MTENRNEIDATIVELDVQARQLARVDHTHPAVRAMHNAAALLTRTSLVPLAEVIDVVSGLLEAVLWSVDFKDHTCDEDIERARALLARLKG